MFHHPAIYESTWQVCSITVFEKKCVISSKCLNDVRAFPQAIKLSMFTLILIFGIPLQHQITQLKIILFSSLVINLLDTFLDNLSLVIHFFSRLLQLDHLIYSSLGIIWLRLHFLQQFHNRDPQRRRENCLSTIYQLVWGHTS